MDYKAIINLIKEMNQNGLTKLEIESDGVRILMEKSTPALASGKPCTDGNSYVQEHTAAYPSLEEAVSMPDKSAKASIDNASDIVKETEAASDTAHTEVPGTKKILSPMVGTFYSQAAPEKPPFVKVGDTIKAGQTICIIEAMKLMNEIESEYDGEILEVLINNEEMVEYGQPMFLIKCHK